MSCSLVVSHKKYKGLLYFIYLFFLAHSLYMKVESIISFSISLPFLLFGLFCFHFLDNFYIHCQDHGKLKKIYLLFVEKETHHWRTNHPGEQCWPDKRDTNLSNNIFSVADMFKYRFWIIIVKLEHLAIL